MTHIKNDSHTKIVKINQYPLTNVIHVHYYIHKYLQINGMDEFMHSPS